MLFVYKYNIKYKTMICFLRSICKSLQQLRIKCFNAEQNNQNKILNLINADFQITHW